jgi:LacI family transcriptional regulator
MTVRRRTTLKDIAAETGYSINTVSVALRGGKKVPEATRAVIVEAARALNYLPNALARSLVSKSSRTVGLLINQLQNPILTLCAEHVERELDSRGYQTVLRSTNGDLEREMRALDSLREHQVEGVLIYPTDDRHLGHLIALRRAAFPVVMLSGAPNPEVDVVANDDRQMTFSVTSHLLSLGHRRIGLLDVGHSHGNFRKIAGFLDAHAAAGVIADPRLVYCPQETNRADVGYARAERFMRLDPPPTAVVCATDLLAGGMLRWCLNNGIDVPGDFSLAGHDDIDISAHLAVPLTTVRYSVEEVSRQAVARLVALIESKDGLPVPTARLIAPELVLRQSTRPPSAGRLRPMPPVVPSTQPIGAEARR